MSDDDRIDFSALDPRATPRWEQLVQRTISASMAPAPWQFSAVWKLALASAAGLALVAWLPLAFRADDGSVARRERTTAARVSSGSDVLLEYEAGADVVSLLEAFDAL